MLCRDVNKDLTFKAKARTKDWTSQWCQGHIKESHNLRPLRLKARRYIIQWLHIHTIWTVSRRHISTIRMFSVCRNSVTKNYTSALLMFLTASHSFLPCVGVYHFGKICAPREQTLQVCTEVCWIMDAADGIAWRWRLSAWLELRHCSSGLRALYQRINLNLSFIRLEHEYLLYIKRLWANVISATQRNIMCASKDCSKD